MKKFKALLSVILAAAVLVCSAIPAFAVTEGETATADEETTVTEEITIDEAISELGLLAAYSDCYYCHVQSSIGWYDIYSYEKNSIQALEEPTLQALELHEKAVTDKTSITMEQIKSAYSNLETAMRNVVIEQSEMDCIIEYCSWETNENSYYPKALWDKFQTALTEAKTTEFTSANEMTEAFWKLYFAYNELCAVNQTPGDVNFDGKVNVLDSTEIQLAVAEMTTLNSSQRMVAENQIKSIDIDITAATSLQLIIAELEEPFSGAQLNELNKNLEDTLYTRAFAPRGNNISFFNHNKVWKLHNAVE